MATSIKEVAARAGVSTGTVSNVLNRPDRVAEGTRARVLAAIEELGFVRNGSAAQLRAGRSRSVGLIVLDVGNPFFTEVARGAEDAADELGCTVIVCNSDERVAREDRHLQVLEEQRVRGVLITPVLGRSARLDALCARGTPAVMVDRHENQPDRCSVAMDDVAGGELAGEHLVGLGHERITYVSGPLTLRQCADRLAGLRRAVSAHGLDPDEAVRVVETGALNARVGYQAAEELTESDSFGTAVFCANDLLALGVLRSALGGGRSVPEDLAIVGYDDIDFASSAVVPLTSVRQPAYQIGRTAARLLLDECDDPDNHAHQQVMFRPELVVRESTVRSDPPHPRRGVRGGRPDPAPAAPADPA